MSFLVVFSPSLSNSTPRVTRDRSPACSCPPRLVPTRDPAFLFPGSFVNNSSQRDRLAIKCPITLSLRPRPPCTHHPTLPPTAHRQAPKPLCTFSRPARCPAFCWTQVYEHSFTSRWPLGHSFPSPFSVHRGLQAPIPITGPTRPRA